jgi:Mg-chelatase subunit ChlD
LVLLAPMTAWAQDPTTPDATTTTVVDVPTTDPAPTTDTTVADTPVTTDTTVVEETPAAEVPAEEAAPAEAAPAEEAQEEQAPADDSAATTSTPARTSTPAVQGASRQAVDQQVTITITSPTDGATVNAGEPLEVTGTVTIGLVGAGVSIVYAVDTSGSTSSGAGPNEDPGDCNGDGVVDAGDDLNSDSSEGEIIDCEIEGVLTLEEQLAAINGSVETGLVDFDDTFQVVTGFGAPGRSELETDVRSFTGSGGTDFDAALQGMNELFATATPGNRKIGYLFTDGSAGITEGPGSPLQAAIDAGIVINTFSVGEGAIPCFDDGSPSPLQVIADATGGQCIEVTDPTQLGAVLENLRPAGIEKVEVSVNGGPPVEASVDLLGNFKVTVTGIIVGANKIVATVTTTDQQTASDEVTVFAGETPPVTGPTPGHVATPVAAHAGTQAGTLPVTGSESERLALLGAALLLAGVAFTFGSVRVARRTH